MSILSASVRIGGLDLDPDEISALLGLAADKAHRRGDPRISSTGRRCSDFSAGLWRITAAAHSSAPLASHLEDLLRRLKGRAEAIQELKSRGFELDIFVGITGPSGKFGIELDHSTMRSIGNLGLDLIFDVYCDDDEEEEEEEKLYDRPTAE